MRKSFFMMAVLILILVEVALGVRKNESGATCIFCLNPYFSGSCSWSFTIKIQMKKNFKVLILILVEVALGVAPIGLIDKNRTSLNPYFSGSCSWRYYKSVIGCSTNSLNPYFSGSCSWRWSK